MAENLKIGDRVEFEVGKDGGTRAFGVVTRIMPGGPLIQTDKTVPVGVRLFNIKKAGAK